MTLIILAILFALFGAAIYLYLLNPHEIIFNLTRNISAEISVVTLMLCAVVLGFGLAIIIVGMKNFSFFFSRRKGKKRDKDNFKSGYKYFFHDRFKEAEKKFRKVISNKPGHARSLFYLGKIAGSRGNGFDAITFHAKAREADRGDIENLYALSEAFEKADKLGDALNTLKEVMKLEHKSAKPFIAMREIYLKRGELEKAIKIQSDLCNIVNEYNSRRENERLNWLKYLLAIEKIKQDDTDSGISMLKEIINRDRNFIPPYVKLSDYFLAMEKEKDAVHILENGYKNTKAYIMLSRLINLYQSKNDDSKIIETIKWATNQNPESTYLSIVLGEFYARKGMNNEVIDLLEKSKKNPSSILAQHLILGMAYEQVNKTIESRKEYNMAFIAGTKDIICYNCSFCGKKEWEWADKCSQCGEFNPFITNTVISG